MPAKSEVFLPAQLEHTPLDKRDDIVAWTHGREARAREEAIAIEMMKNLREKVAWCQRAHPVTHYYDCAEIVGKYLALAKDPFKGVKTPGVGESEE